MDKEIVKQKHEQLKSAMNDLCKSAESDQKLLSEIQSRDFWARFFANNTRDLARAGIAQTELIEKVQSSMQDMLAIVKDGAERERLLISTIDDLRESGDSAIASICTKLGKVIRVVAKENNVIDIIKMRVAASDSAQASQSAAKACVKDITEYCQKAAEVNSDEFCKLVEKVLSKHFTNKGVSLRGEDKQTITMGVKALGLPMLDYDQGFGAEKLPVELIMGRELEIASPEGDRYAEFRNELVGLIDELVACKTEVDPKGRSIGKLCDVKARLLESQFEIALIGEFQGGKSTTFNALCGGREISPRGLGTGGVKTSAAVITAQNISGNEKREGLSEWAEVKWLPETALKHRIADALHVEDSVSTAELKKLIQESWKFLSKDEDDERDILQVATLQLRLLVSGRYKELTSKKIVPIDEFQKYVQFPKNWELRWGEREWDADFTLEECLFSCLDSVLVRIHSEYLERLGCRITDCPGLFVSKWDTDRALAVMSRSNAVWYLLNGNKEMGQDQKRVLQSIRQGGWHAKCFFTLNVKGDEASTEGIFQSNVTKIKNAGFNVENRIFKYNAAVAFRLAQLDWLKHGCFSRRDTECLATEEAVVTTSQRKRRERNRKWEEIFKEVYPEILKGLESDGVEKKINSIRNQIYWLLIPTYYDDSIKALDDAKFLNELEDFAGLKNIVRCLERHITSHGAAEILLGDNGSGAGLCLHVLNALAGDKKNEEALAVKQYQHAQEEWARDQKRFDKFIKQVKLAFGFLENDTKLDEEFLLDFYRWGWDDIHKSAEASAIEMTLQEWNSGHMTNTGVKEAATHRIKEEFARVFKLSLDRYAHNIGSTPLYRRRIGDRISEAWKDLIEEWDEIEKESPHFEGLCPDSELVKVHISPFGNAIEQNIDIPSYFSEVFRNFVNIIASWFGGKRETSQDRIRNFFREKDPIGSALNDMKESVSKSVKFKELFAEARLQNKQKIDKSIADASEKFNARIEQEKEAMSATDEERKRKADEARRAREEIIEPRIKTLIDFSSRVRAAYGE